MSATPSTLKRRFGLSIEAQLLDTTAFILKTALAMFAAFAIGQHIPYANRDMISFLFAMMLSLEPVSSTGFKRGKDQFIATLIGALVSGAIVAVVGINPLGLALSMAAILYLTLAKSWRELSVVALFTGIYMTQYIQNNPLGQPDILLTMGVRIVALTSGIAFAMIFNMIVSVALMGKLPQKRMRFLAYRLSRHVSRLVEKLEKGQALVDDAHLSMSHTFNDIDWTIGLLSDLKNDPLLFLGRLKPAQVEVNIERAKNLRTFCHLLFDIDIHLRLYPSDQLTSNYRSYLVSQLKSFEAALISEAQTGLPKAISSLSDLMNKVGKMCTNPLECRIDANLSHMHW